MRSTPMCPAASNIISMVTPAPFTFDVTDPLISGANKMVVRVVVPGHEPIDGLTRRTIPHGLHGMDESAPCWGGIWQSIGLYYVPEIYIADVFAETDWAEGAVIARVTINNTAGRSVSADLNVTVSEDRTGKSVMTSSAMVEVCPCESVHSLRLDIPSPHSWSPDDPFLYRLEVETLAGGIEDRRAVRFGLRELTFSNGYFRLNGKRFFPRSAHFVGFYPGGLRPKTEDDLRREIVAAKEAGFNMLRYLGTAAVQPQLDMADEIGLLVYEEHAGSWQMEDGPETAKRHERELFDVIRRDRNHPSVVMWGVLNEWFIFVPEGHIAANAIGVLPRLRRLDPTRLVTLDSGRFNYARWHMDMFPTLPGVGNLSLPRTTEWIDDLADVHTYGEYPIGAQCRTLLRSPKVGDRKVFQTEFGFNTSIDLFSGILSFQQSGVPADNEEREVWQSLADRLERDWSQLKMAEVFPTPSHMWDADLEAHSFRIRQAWSLVQANPRLVGTNYTSFCDEGLYGAGIVDYFRQPKPAIRAIRDLQKPLVWCLFSSSLNLYRGRDLRVEAVLRNEDVLPPGRYPAEITLSGPSGTVWHCGKDIAIPSYSEGEEETGPVAIEAFEETVRMDFPAGDYELYVRLLSGADARASLTLHLGDREALPRIDIRVSALGMSEQQCAWIQDKGVETRILHQIFVSQAF
ncbi:MAG: hypothetical protein HYX78_00510 [Armatimonadetes bacterium]|nr:hypothetical protein [Armatimonadota bacterium]